MLHDAVVRRRSLLAAPPLLAAGLGLASPAARAQTTAVANEAAWDRLARDLRGPVLRPWDREFIGIAPAANLRYATRMPAGIARCADARDIATALRWAQDERMPLVARSGGHSYAGYSTTSGLMIETTLMNGARFDRADGTVTIEGGVRNRGVYELLRAADRTITHGVCPNVGAAGFLLGGGVGFDMRDFGIGSDRLRASEMVTADGRLLRLGATENAELFWACRGAGGGNFGINTAFTVETSPTRPTTAFILQWDATTRRPEALLEAMMGALARAPNTLGALISVGASHPGARARGEDITIVLRGQFKASPRELRDILAPAYDIATPTLADIRFLPYWQAQDMLTEPPEPAYYQERSTFLSTPVLGDAMTATAFRFLRDWPGTLDGGDIRLFLTGGQVNAMAPDATAFVHRASQWLMVVASDWTMHDDAVTIARSLEWQAAFYAAMRGPATRGAYQNFMDPSLADWQPAYHGDNLARLKAVKRAVDPGMIFTFDQAIPPA